MEIVLEKKSVFGNELFYPCEKNGTTILRLMDRKSFTPEQVAVMKNAGWNVKAKQVEI